VGAAYEVRKQVGGLERRLGARRDVEGHEVVARVGVELRAQPFRRLVDVAVMGVLLAALEHQVLEEVGHAVLLGTLGACSGIERDEHRGGASALQPDPVQGQAVGQDRGRDLRHDTEGSTPVRKSLGHLAAPGGVCRSPDTATDLRPDVRATRAGWVATGALAYALGYPALPHDRT
jgi:hypothetical protein